MRRQGESRTGTKSEITGRNRNQSTRALADTDPSASTTPQNRLIPMNHAHYDNQPPPSHPPEAPKPRTKPENESLQPIWPTPAPAGKQPPTAHHTKTAEFQRPANNTTIKHRPAISPPTTQPPEPVDRIGEHTPKSDPVHTDTGRHPTINLCDTTKPLNSNNPPVGPAPISAYRPPRGPITRTESEIILRNRTQSSQASADTRPPTTATPQNR